MIDLAKVRNYYIACGYTDLRLGIDGLVAVVTQQYGSHLNEESLASPSSVADIMAKKYAVSSPGPSGEDLGQRGRGAELGHHG
jgi:hypothetical protein